jgi:hypothetical protein
VLSGVGALFGLFPLVGALDKASAQAFGAGTVNLKRSVATAYDAVLLKRNRQYNLAFAKAFAPAPDLVEAYCALAVAEYEQAAQARLSKVTQSAGSPGRRSVDDWFGLTPQPDVEVILPMRSASVASSISSLGSTRTGQSRNSVVSELWLSLARHAGRPADHPLLLAPTAFARNKGFFCAPRWLDRGSVRPAVGDTDLPRR